MPPKEESRTKDEAYLKQLEELREDLGLGKDGDTIARIAESVEKRLASTRSFTTAAGATNEDGSRATKGMTLGEFAQAVAVIEHPTRWNKQVSPDVRKALGEATGSTGGFLLYEQFVPELQKLVIEDQVVRPHAKVVPMTTDTIWYPKIVDISHASSVHGGVRGTWGAEAGALGTGDPNFGQFRLIAKKFSDYVLVSNELVADSPISVEAILKDLLREGLGFFEDCSFLSGTGVGEPKGVLNCGALISGERTSTGHVVYDDLVNMQSRLFPSSWKRAVWVASPAVFPDLAKMSVAVGTGGSAIWINGFGSNMANAAPQTLLGRPLIISEKVPTLGTAGDIMLCDFSYYIIGDRMQMALTSSDQVAFATDQTAFRIIERLDGAPWIDSALTPKNGGATLSAFITLAA